jgi:type II secretory pathway component GspD/PulD (secretin)
MIEAVIVDVQLDDETEIGINWDILSDKMYDFSYRQNLGSRLSMVAATDDTKADTTAFNTTSATGTEGGYFAVISGTVRNTVHLLQQKKNVEILASPRVMVVSGESASIETVTELPYQELMQTSGGGQLSATQFKKVGVKLNVTATLTDDDYILVTVEPEQSVDTGKFSATSGIPIIDTRKAKTTLLLKDGQVVIIGGLRKKETTNQISQIPLLGDLPLIGILFRNTQEIVKNSELLVFLSPHIYKGETLSEEQKAKFEEFKEQPTLSLPTDGDKDNQLHNADKQPQKK